MAGIMIYKTKKEAEKDASIMRHKGWPVAKVIKTACGGWSIRANGNEEYGTYVLENGYVG